MNKYQKYYENARLAIKALEYHGVDKIDACSLPIDVIHTFGLSEFEGFNGCKVFARFKPSSKKRNEELKDNVILIYKDPNHGITYSGRQYREPCILVGTSDGGLLDITLHCGGTGTRYKKRWEKISVGLSRLMDDYVDVLRKLRDLNVEKKKIENLFDLCIDEAKK